jgi:hypothetical protein
MLRALSHAWQQIPIASRKLLEVSTLPAMGFGAISAMILKQWDLVFQR